VCVFFFGGVLQIDTLLASVSLGPSIQDIMRRSRDGLKVVKMDVPWM